MDLIVPHINTDFDGLASAVAACRMYPGARIALPGGQERNVRDYLAARPLAGGVLKVKQALKEKPDRLILVDVSGPERLGELRELLTRPGVAVIRFDHHALRQDLPGETAVVRPYGANTTILVEALRERGLTLEPWEATLCALGIYEETGNLTYTSTTAEDLDAAAWLLRQGADLHVVSEFSQRPLSAEQQALFDDLLKSRETLSLNGLEISLSSAEREHFIEDAAVLASKLIDLENLETLFVLVRMGRRVYVVGRSRGADADLTPVFAALGGGGHARAGSAALRDETLAGARRRLLEAVRARLAPAATARDIMSTPVVTVKPGAAVDEARRLMLRYGHSGLPVVDRGLVGIITRQDVDKALHHGLDRSAVRQTMSTRLVVARPEESLVSLRRRMIENNISHIPVVARGRLLGIVTRNDLLRALVEKGPAAPPPADAGLPDDRLADLQDLRALMRERLPERILNLLHTAGETADARGVNAFVVGGFVRDLLLHAEDYDLDIVVEGDGIAYAQALGRRLGATVKTHPRFKTAHLEWGGGRTLDVATARTEYYSRPAALPQVESSSIKYDLVRRDFTINAMAVRLNPPEFGQLVDFFNGRGDLREGVVRVLHPASFIDDPTRLFRAARFEQRLGFRLDADTERYARHAVTLGVQRHLSLPRVFDELWLIFDEPQPERALARLEKWGVLTWVHPGVHFTRDTDRRFHALWDVLAFAVLFLEGPPDRRALYGMALLEPLSVAEIRALARNAQWPRRFGDILCQQKIRGERIRQWLEGAANPRPSRIVGQLEYLPLEVLLYEMAKSFKGPAGHRIRDFLTRWRNIKPILTGKDLKKMGYVPGPGFEHMLRQLRAARLDGKVVTRQDEVAWVRKRFESNGEK